MLPKGKFICMLKSKFCVASFRFLTIIILFVFVFFFFYTYDLALNALVSAKIRVKSSFSHLVLGRSGCRCSRAIFPPSHLLPPRKNGYIAIFPPSLLGGEMVIQQNFPPEKWLFSPPLQVGGEWLYSGFYPLNVISNLL